MKKVIKIKESKVLEIIDNIINEQASQSISVSASNQLGTYPNFDGLKTLAKDLRTNVETALRGSTPYRIKTDNPNGVAIARIQGSALKLIITLVPCKEEDRDWYFDLSLAIYSEINTPDGFKVLSAKVMEKAAQRGQAFVGSQGKIESLGRNHIQLDQLPNLDPKKPNNVFNLYVIYIAGARPKGYQRAELETGGGEQSKQASNTQNAVSSSDLKNVSSIKEGDFLYGIRSVDNQKYKLTFAPFKEGYDGFGVYITGPGTYEGKKLDGTVAYDLKVYSNKPGELQGNNEMGSFKLIASGEVTSTSTVTKPEETKTTSEEEVIKKVSGKFTTNVADTAHNFKNLEDKLGPILKEMYDMGINPKITELSATISKNGEQYTTIYRATVSKSDDGKAWMGFTSRGSIGPGLIRGKTYEQRADGQIDGTENSDSKSLEEKLKGIGAGEIDIIKVYHEPTVFVKQYFVQFTKPKEFPPHK